jgi:5-formyltetrahydrofolate cyclo-ligase
MNQDVTQHKAELREQLKQARDALTPAQRREYSRAIRERLLQLPQVQAAASVFCFVSNGSEVDTHPLLDEFLRDGKTVAVPRITRDRGMLAVPFSGWEELQPGQLGILSPVSDRPYAGAIDVCITPGLGFTVMGKRLGYGRGYYDRWFAGHAVADRIAVGFECQVLDDLPAGSNDVPVTMLVTESRLILID